MLGVKSDFLFLYFLFVFKLIFSFIVDIWRVKFVFMLRFKIEVFKLILFVNKVRLR